jgi:hypothetical protein
VRYFEALAGERAEQPTVIFGGYKSVDVRTVRCLSFRDLESVLAPG